MKYCTLIRSKEGHVFRMAHGDTPPKGFEEIKNCCRRGVLKNPLAWSLPRVKDAFNEEGEMLRHYPIFTEEQITNFTKAQLW